MLNTCSGQCWQVFKEVRVWGTRQTETCNSDVGTVTEMDTKYDENVEEGCLTHSRVTENFK